MNDNEQPSFSTPPEVKIILAEDNPVNQKVGLMMLNRCGFSATAASNGIEVIELLKQSSWDLILMDIQMPRMGGIRTTKIIRDPESDVPCKDIPIIAMTASSTPEDEKLCLDSGMDAYLTKPIACKKLIAMINSVVSRQ